MQFLSTTCIRRTLKKASLKSKVSGTVIPFFYTTSSVNYMYTNIVRLGVNHSKVTFNSRLRMDLQSQGRPVYVKNDAHMTQGIAVISWIYVRNPVRTVVY